MDERLKIFSETYDVALESYLAQAKDSTLEAAYNLGRQAVAAKLGLLKLAKVHQEAMGRILAGKPELARNAVALKQAEGFLLEAVAPFEATHREARESCLHPAQLNETLSQRNLELAVMNRNLANEVAERNRQGKALRQSEEHYRVLLKEARQTQENLRHLSSRMLHAQEEERKRISRELHDEVGQALTAINVHLAVLDKGEDLTSKKTKNRIAEARRLLEETMETVHRFSRELRPAMLDDLGLAPALRSYVRAFAQRNAVSARFGSRGDVEKMGSEQKLVLYRVAQESLTNVAKHAQATKVLVRLRHCKNGISLEISDNGKAFSVDKQIGGSGQERLGLLGIQERIRLVQGEFALKSEPGKGTTVRVQVPF